jgi:hypothetical protein
LRGGYKVEQVVLAIDMMSKEKQTLYVGCTVLLLVPYAMPCYAMPVLCCHAGNARSRSITSRIRQTVCKTGAEAYSTSNIEKVRARYRKQQSRAAKDIKITKITTPEVEVLKYREQKTLEITTKTITKQNKIKSHNARTRITWKRVHKPEGKGEKDSESFMGP